ncbi:MAG: patatin-like phospholipase family protein [Candidatus Woesearchaeota archaeon]
MAKIGLILGGGGTRGYAHIGVLKVIDKLGIKIDAVAGCSVGSLIGAAYCSGTSPDEIEKYAKKLGLLDVFDVNISPKGIRTTKKLEKIFNDTVQVNKFEDLKIPLFINAVNLSKTKEEIFSKGNIFDAIRASVSVPGLVSPYKIGSDYYVDGGVMNSEPVSILPNTIKRYIIVDVSPLGKLEIEKANVIDIIDISMRIMQKESWKLRNMGILKRKHVIIKPNLYKNLLLEPRKKYTEIIKEGEIAALRKQKELQNLSKSWYHLKK